LNAPDRQPDLFGGGGWDEPPADPVFEDCAPLDPAALSDSALIQAFANAYLREATALAAEAERRKLAAAVPALGALCRRFKGFGRHAPIAEQRAAFAALAQIGGREAADLVVRLIAEAVVQAPGLPDALAAAVRLGGRLPSEIALVCLRDPRPDVRRDACRLVRPSAETVAVLIDLLSDLHDSVSAAAACALGRLGRVEGRGRLVRLLANAPSAEAIDAFARIADDDGLVVLGRLAGNHPNLAGAVLDALEESDRPHAAVVAAGVRRRLGLGA